MISVDIHDYTDLIWVMKELNGSFKIFGGYDLSFFVCLRFLFTKIIF
jgi:hypothetical protein